MEANGLMCCEIYWCVVSNIKAHRKRPDTLVCALETALSMESAARDAIELQKKTASENTVTKIAAKRLE